jgi:exopolyphosphatase/guanosine-5'-triphosphate,3'-diphosphate pyrophosphatase
VAAVDLGSNSFHMLVARTEGGVPVVVDRLREMVQLASGLDDEDRLDEPARTRALACLRRFGERVRHMPAEAVRAVGTNTLRRARDARAFVVEAEQALGHTIETISGMEEARLIYIGVTQTLPEPWTRRLVVDIGGGSTELIVGEGTRPLDLESLYMGCISFSRAHFPDGELGPRQWRRAETAAMQELEPLRARFRDAGWSEAVGASGTVRAIDSLVRIQGWSEDGITPRALERLRDALIGAGKVSRLALPGLDPQRAPYLAGGAAIVAALVETLGIRLLRRSDGALREGLLHDLIGRIRETDVRGHSVEALGERCHVDWKQAHRVEHTALHLLGEVAEAWDLDSRQARQFLSWAAQLHEIGLDIAHDHHHWHGQYILAHSDLPGFSRPEQQLLATLVRAHRRKFPTDLFRELPEGWRRLAGRLAILLRLAVVLHRSRSPDPLPGVGLAVRKKTLELELPEGWLEAHPLTGADLETEAAYLAAAGFRLRSG